MRLNELVSLLQSDFARYSGNSKNPSWVYIAKFFHNPGMLFSLMYRIERALMFESGVIGRTIGLLLYPFYFVVTYFILDIHIEPGVVIGSGLFLHNRGIVITDNTRIGKNASIMGQVTIATDFDSRNPCIIIGNNFRCGTGSRIIVKEKLTIVDNVTVGANAVVVTDITKKGVYIGVPARRA